MIILVVSLIISSLETYVSFEELVSQNYFCHSKTILYCDKMGYKVQQVLENDSDCMVWRYIAVDLCCANH